MLGEDTNHCLHTLVCSRSFMQSRLLYRHLSSVAEDRADMQSSQLHRSVFHIFRRSGSPRGAKAYLRRQLQVDIRRRSSIGRGVRPSGEKSHRLAALYASAKQQCEARVVRPKRKLAFILIPV